MKRYVGLDVSQDGCAVCILNEDGTRMFEGIFPADPGAILRTVTDHAGPVDRIVHETGPLSIWLTRKLVKRVTPVVCIDARAANKAQLSRSASSRPLMMQHDSAGRWV